jgi:hypothetical protein
VNFDTSKPREGNLMLCECGHLKTFHFQRAKWHGGPLSDNEPCAHCAGGPNTTTGCQAFKAGSFQGYVFKQAHA